MPIYYALSVRRQHSMSLKAYSNSLNRKYYWRRRVIKLMDESELLVATLKVSPECHIVKLDDSIAEEIINDPMCQ